MTTICEYITESEVKASQYIELGASIASFIGIKFIFQSSIIIRWRCHDGDRFILFSIDR